MNQFDKSIVPVIESVYQNLSQSEKNIALFFIKNKELKDFSSKKMAELLYVSESTLSRFSKKCGFKGYREFVYAYRMSLHENEEKITDLTKKVLSTYQELLNRSYSLVKDDQMQRVVRTLAVSKKVFVYGIGSSGMCAREFKIRFMRLGLAVEYIVDEHIMKMNTVLIDSDSLLIAISVSGKNLQEYLKMAKTKGANTMMITANYHSNLRSFCDEIILTAMIEHLDVGNVISPQFPTLVILDILYTHYLNSNYHDKYAYLTDTLTFVKKTDEV